MAKPSTDADKKNRQKKAEREIGKGYSPEKADELLKRPKDGGKKGK